MTDIFHASKRFGGVDVAVEIHPPPLRDGDQGVEADDAESVFRTNDFTLFLSSNKSVKVYENDRQTELPTQDFVRWQLSVLPSHVVFDFINKTALDLDHVFEDDDEILDADEFEVFNVCDCLDDGEYRDAGCKVVEWLLERRKDQLLRALSAALLDEDDGMLAWLESDISTPEDFVRRAHQYADWPVKIVLVYRGRFDVEFDADQWRESRGSLYHLLMMNSYQWDSCYVRNYDEGDI